MIPGGGGGGGGPPAAPAAPDEEELLAPAAFTSEANHKAREFMQATPRVLSPDEWLRGFVDFILQVRGLSGLLALCPSLSLPPIHPPPADSLISHRQGPSPRYLENARALVYLEEGEEKAHYPFVVHAQDVVRP